MYASVLRLVVRSCPTLCDHMDCSLPGSSVHGVSPGKNTGVGCHVFLQGIIPTQGSNPGLLHFRQILYCLSHQGSPKRSRETWSDLIKGTWDLLEEGRSTLPLLIQGGGFPRALGGGARGAKLGARGRGGGGEGWGGGREGT